jgi:hypothetical protein
LGGITEVVHNAARDRLTTVLRDGAAHVWALDLNVLMSRSKAAVGRNLTPAEKAEFYLDPTAPDTFDGLPKLTTIPFSREDPPAFSVPDAPSSVYFPAPVSATSPSQVPAPAAPPAAPPDNAAKEAAPRKSASE